MDDTRYAKRDLGAHGTLQMTSLADLSTGAVRYWLTAPHVRGSVVLVPALLFDDPTDPWVRTADLYIFARLDGPGGAGRNERPLSINGIQLTGRSAVNSSAPHDIKAFRASKTGLPEEFPARSRLLARSVLGAAAEHWSERDDRAVLDGLALRSTARHFLNHYEAELEQRQQSLRRAQLALAETRERISTLRDLSEAAAPRPTCT